jgi:hypothetical protein
MGLWHRCAVIVAAGAVLLAASAWAGGQVEAGRPGGKGGTKSIALNQADPHLGDWVTFSSSGGSRIALACYQGGLGDMVYSADQPADTAFLLGGTDSKWAQQGGEALCYAWLYSRSLTRGLAASTSFTAAGAR